MKNRTDTAAPEGGENKDASALMAWSRAWILDGDICRCRGCGRGISRDYSARALKPENAHLARFLNRPSGNPGQPSEPFHFMNCMGLGLCECPQPPSGQETGTPRTDTEIQRIEDSTEDYAWRDICTHDRTLEHELTAAREEIVELRAMIAKSSLIEVEATTVVDRGGHPVIVKDGTMLVHKDDKIRVEQRTKDLQKTASLARENARQQETIREMREHISSAVASANGNFEAEDGERAFLIHSDQMEGLKAALALADGKGGEGE